MTTRFRTLGTFTVLTVLASFASCDRTPPPDASPETAVTNETTAYVDADSTGWLFTSHILIRHRDRHSPTDSIRTNDEARILAESVHRRIEEGERSFGDLARTFTEDDSNRDRGGRLGPFQVKDADSMYAARAHSLAPGDVSAPFDTDLGYLIIKRHPLEVATFQSVLVGFDGTELSRSDRTKDEARAIAEEAHAAVRSNRPFESVAEEFSDRDPDDITIEVARGVMSKSVDDIVFSLEPGELSAVQETEYGFHVIRRIR